MLTPSPEDFRNNQLSVVTFNFDRSFERALIVSLQANYGVNEEGAVKLAQSVPVALTHTPASKNPATSVMCRAGGHGRI